MKIETYKENGSALKESEQWKVISWLWDNLERCPDVDYVVDVGAAEGTITFMSSTGDEYTLKLQQGNWRELK